MSLSLNHATEAVGKLMASRTDISSYRVEFSLCYARNYRYITHTAWQVRAIWLIYTATRPQGSALPSMLYLLLIIENWLFRNIHVLMIISVHNF